MSLHTKLLHKRVFCAIRSAASLVLLHLHFVDTFAANSVCLWVAKNNKLSKKHYWLLVSSWRMVLGLLLAFKFDNGDFDDDVHWIRASVKKMVQATGMLTATRFFPNPRVKKPRPSVWYKYFTVSGKLLFDLNISLRTTSKGFVKPAPASPAVADFKALRYNCSEGDCAGGRTSSMTSFTTTAVQYLGTVFKIPADVPCQRPEKPCFL